MNSLSLFSGLGGMDVGFEEAGFCTLGAVEINKYACESLKLNRRLARKQERLVTLNFIKAKQDSLRQRRQPDWISDYETGKTINSGEYLKNCIVFDKDIKSLSPRNIDRLTRGKAIDLLHGGSPCQSFSMSGQRKSLEDERGQLFLEFARVAEYIRPKYIVFENVKGILSARGDNKQARCQECDFLFMPTVTSILNGNTRCNRCGSSSVNITTIKRNAPGMAIKIISNEFESLGYQTSFAVFNCSKLGGAQKRERVILIASRHDQIFIEADNLIPRSKNGQNLAIQHDIFKKSDQDFVYEQTAPTLRQILIKTGEHLDLLTSPNACLWLRNVVRPHAEPVTWSLDQPSPTIGSHQGAKLAIAPNGVPREQIELQQWHTKGKRLGKGNQLKVVYTFLSDKTLLALQSFPSDWAVCGTRMERSFQIGNAVPSILARHIGNAIKKSLVSQQNIFNNNVTMIEDIRQSA